MPIACLVWLWSWIKRYIS